MKAGPERHPTPIGVACCNPLTGFRAPDGKVKLSGAHVRRTAAELRLAGLGDDQVLSLPCGQCIGCRVDRQRSWMLRCLHEATLHSRSCFLTLTYDDEHLPDDVSLDVEEFKRFMKRLRRRLQRRGVDRLRYLHVGEYGEESLRPHYHALLFGYDFAMDRRPFRKGKQPLWESALLTDTWQQGIAVIGELNRQTVAYCCRYVVKKLTGDEGVAARVRVDPDTGECWEVKPEYHTASRRPGLGAGWLERWHKDVYPHDQVVTLDGKAFKPPRFYDSKMAESFPELMERVKAKRVERSSQRLSEGTHERNRVREEVARRNLNNKVKRRTV